MSRVSSSRRPSLNPLGRILLAVLACAMTALVTVPAQAAVTAPPSLAPPEYTVTYDGNEADTGSPPVDADSPHAVGSSVTVLPNSGGLARTGYRFAYWNTTADGNGTAYDPGNTFEMPGAPVTLYATWAIQRYPVTYDANGATSGAAPVDVGSPHKYGLPVSVLDNSGNLAKTGSAFMGWNTAADGSGTHYAPNSSFDMPAYEVVLYAQWEPIVASMTLHKRATTASFGAVGSLVDYVFTVTNIGNVTLSSVAVADAGIDAPADCEITTLVPSEWTYCYGSHAVTQADVDRGTLANTATASGTSVSGPVSSPSATVTLPGPVAAPALTLALGASPTSYKKVGQVLTYTATVRNAGNVTIAGVSLVGPTPSLTCQPALPSTLTPGAFATCTGRYAVTAADLVAGSVTRTATATGQPTRGSLAPVRATSVVRASLVDLLMSKTHSGSAYVGRLTTFRLTVKNLSPRAATGIQVTDTLPAGLAFVSARGTDWTCRVVRTVPTTRIACSLEAMLTLGETSEPITLTVRPTVASTLVNVATVTSPFTELNPANNTARASLRVLRQAQVPAAPISVRSRPGALLITPGVTNAGQPIRVAVRCAPISSSAASGALARRGDVTYCRVSSARGVVTVRSGGPYPMGVAVTYSALGTSVFRPYLAVGRYTIRSRG